MREVDYDDPMQTIRKMEAEYGLTSKQMSAYMGMSWSSYRHYAYTKSPMLSLDTLFRLSGASDLACRLLVDGIVLKTKKDVNEMFCALTDGVPAGQRKQTFLSMGHCLQAYYYWRKSIKVDNLKRYCDKTGHLCQMYVGLKV